MGGLSAHGKLPVEILDRFALLDADYGAMAGMRPNLSATSKMKYTSPAALPASDAAWIMLNEVMPVRKGAAQFAVEIGLAPAERYHGCGDRR